MVTCGQGVGVYLQSRVSVHCRLDVAAIHGPEDDHDGVKLLLPHFGWRQRGGGGSFYNLHYTEVSVYLTL